MHGYDHDTEACELDHAARKCAEKTSRGNVYETFASALDSAIHMSWTRGGQIIPFACKVCGKFHVGSWLPHREESQKS